MMYQQTLPVPRQPRHDNGLLLSAAMNRAVLAPLLVLGACGADLGHGAESVEMKDPMVFHRTEGFVQMTPPAHLPSSAPDQDQVEIWVSLPAEGLIHGAVNNGNLLLEFPAGTRADRVEFSGSGKARRITDIRGSTVLRDGQRFHVYRPSAPQPNAPLFGARWPAGKPDAHAAATAYLTQAIAASKPFDAMEPTRREAVLKSFRGKNNCLPCHNPARPENLRANEHGVVNRGTDLSGFFTPSTVFADEVPLESYGGFDRTLDDPLIDVLCDGQVVETLPARRCPSGSLPRARWRWDRAWELDASRARARCELADHLAARLDPAIQGEVASFLDNCKGNDEKTQ